jgi:two-component system phosphate regulon sensor histidine kinase PhoR
MVIFWPPVLFRLAVVLALALAAGFVLGETWGYLTAIAGLLVLIGLHLYYLRRVTAWFAPQGGEPDMTELPEGFGAWESVFQALRLWRRREREQHSELERMFERFMEAASALPDGIVILDAADRVEWCNVRATEHFGLNAARDRGYSVTNLIRHPAFIEYLVHSDTADPLVLADEASGTVLSVQLLPFQQMRRMIVSRDISQWRRVDAMRQDFIANVSHEMRTPLTVVAGFLEHLADSPDMPPAERARIAQTMLEQSRRMRRLIDDLLTLSKLETQEAPTLNEAFSVADFIYEAVNEARTLSATRHTIAVRSLSPVEIRGAREEIRSAIENLLSNAVRYTPEGGKIEVTGLCDADALRIGVSDTGPGIAVEHLPRLTERFYRVDKSRSRETGGTGLGLAIVKHVLVRHGGRLDIESQPGAGSTFTMVLPAARVSQDAGAVEADK